MKKINILSPGFETPNGSAFLFPLIIFSKQLKSHGIKINIYSKLDSRIFDADIIGVDSKFHKYLWSHDEDTIYKNLSILKKNCGSLIYFDTTDSTGNLQTEVFNYVDLYCKGQILKNRNKYLEPFYGNRIFSDFAYKNFKIKDKFPEYSKPLTNKNDLKKLQVSWNTGLADYSPFGPSLMKMYRYFPIKKFLSFKNIKVIQKKDILHARFGDNYSKNSVAWQRKKISILLKNIENRKISRLKYFSELKRTRISISPFGWGEITLKDFESFLCNAILFKPSMEHLDTWPNFFIQDKTYVPFSWDLSDFISKLSDLEKNYLNFLDIAINGRKNYLIYASKSGEEKFTQHFLDILHCVN